MNADDDKSNDRDNAERLRDSARESGEQMANRVTNGFQDTQATFEQFVDAKLAASNAPTAG